MTPYRTEKKIVFIKNFNQKIKIQLFPRKLIKPKTNNEIKKKHLKMTGRFKKVDVYFKFSL